LSAAGDFKFTVGDWKVNGVYGAPTFARLSNRRRNVQILIVDSFLWFQGSLEKAAQLFCPDLPKLEKPKRLGSFAYTSANDHFVAYAMRDAEIDYHIGVSVQRLVHEFDIRQPVSLANMAALIFKRHYLRYTIPQPSAAIIDASLKSYHGGKNNIVKGTELRWHEDVSLMDISSAYPYAMSLCPAFSREDLYKRYTLTRGAKHVPDFGVYQVSGYANTCDWPVIFRHDFEPITGGNFHDIWIQGFELNEAIRSEEISVEKIRGYYYDSDKDSCDPSLLRYVLDFYARKQSASDQVLRHMYKILLNALYGKFIQTRKNSRVLYTDTDSEVSLVEAGDLVAGGLFQPFIASAITAHPRAYIHQIEHAHAALHTATDGIVTREKKARRVPHGPSASEGLGTLTIEARGDLLLFRNKLNILYGDLAAKKYPLTSSEKKNGVKPSKAFPGKRIIKFAKHGFQGTEFDLERLAASGDREYYVTTPNQLRESVKRGLDVNKFEKRRKSLKLGDIQAG
jgi:hypothetical protein